MSIWSQVSQSFKSIHSICERNAKCLRCKSNPISLLIWKQFAGLPAVSPDEIQSREREIHFSLQRNPIFCAKESLNQHPHRLFIHWATYCKHYEDRKWLLLWEKFVQFQSHYRSSLAEKKVIRHIGWLSDNLTHFMNLRPIILMSIQCGYHSWISVHHAAHNSQTKIPNANILGRLLEMYNLLGTYVSAELTDCRQNLALSSSCRSEKNSFGLRSNVTSLSWEYIGCKTSTNHTCKKCVMLRRRLFWPKKNCGKSA